MKDKKNKYHEVATFGAGSFYGTEKFFAADFADKFPNAILGTTVGFMSSNPRDDYLGPIIR